MRYLFPTFLLILCLHHWLYVLPVYLHLLDNLLPDLCRHLTPVFQLLWVELIDTEVGMRVLVLPLDGIKVGA